MATVTVTAHASFGEFRVIFDGEDWIISKMIGHTMHTMSFKPEDLRKVLELINEVDLAYKANAPKLF